LAAGSTYEFMIDFDAHASIVTTGNPQNPNGYKLKPTLRVVEVATTGSISGTVLNPANAPLAVVSQSGVEVTSTPVDVNTGAFRLAYLLPGDYDLTITDVLNQTYSQQAITVTAGADNAIGDVTLQ
ncbi:MAG: carboxypeptidase regulatory-like domain-containing protein, partial [Bacteroidota bacterium]|nr:carboxypeptidase regulatory-like domain-containing protein [Bacteroidota bacterium]